MSSDSDIRFTRKKLGDNQRCGCILIAGFLVMLLVAGLVLYAGCELLSSIIKSCCKLAKKPADETTHLAVMHNSLSCKEAPN